jgi:phosphate transport system permease protein
VVYGFFGLVVMVPFILQNFSSQTMYGSSWLAASILLGIMALPIIISVSEDAMRAVPNSYREASLSMGATKWETTRKVVVPAAASGIAAATILGLGRAMGETMAVLMVAGNTAIIPEPLWNVFSTLRALTATLALEMPEVIPGSVHYSALFMLGLILMIMVLLVNMSAKMIMKRTNRKFGAPSTKPSWLNKIPGFKAIFGNPVKVKSSLLLTLIFFVVWAASYVVIGAVYGAILAFIVIVAWVVLEVCMRNANKAKGNKKDTAVIMTVASLMSKHSGIIKRSLIIVLLFVFAWMMTSLLVSSVYAAIAATAIVGAWLGFGEVMKRIGATNRQKVAHGSLLAVVAVVMLILAILISDIVIKGVPALSWDFLTQYPSRAGRQGGIYPAIIGTLKLIIGTMLIAFPLGIFTGVYLAEYSKDTPVTRILREAIDILNGTPSIVFGLFGMAALVVFLGWGFSLIAGCITLALMILPMVIRTTEETVRAVPDELREASFAMGATKWKTVTKVVLPAAFGGVVTGLILSIGRATGETAPIMFTAVVALQSRMSMDIFSPVMALPYHLYYLAAEVPGSSMNQYGTALVLMIIVLSMFALASIIRYRYDKKVRW